MQRLAMERRQTRIGLAVDRIADQRVADRCHVHANLVRPACFQGAFKQRAVVEDFQHAIPGQRRLATTTFRHHGHLGPMNRMPADRRIDAVIASNDTGSQRQVLPLDRARLQLADQVGLCLQRLGDDKQSTGFLVQAMHDAGARHFGNAGHVMQQRIHQRTAPIAATRMHHKPGRLVDDKQRVVLEDDIERDVFRGFRTVASIVGHGDGQRLATEQFALGFAHRFAIDSDTAFLHPVLQTVARMLR